MIDFLPSLPLFCNESGVGSCREVLWQNNEEHTHNNAIHKNLDAYMFFNVFSVGSLLPLNFGSGLAIVSWYL